MLFEDNINFMSFIKMIPKDQDDLLVDSNEGFLKGNMFKDEYVPYKDYKIASLQTCSEQEAFLYKIMELNFAINDLNLYLDLHKENKEVFNVLIKYLEENKKLEKEYAEKYGALELSDLKENYSYLNNPWPWCKEDAKNV